MRKAIRFQDNHDVQLNKENVVCAGQGLELASAETVMVLSPSWAL